MTCQLCYSDIILYVFGNCSFTEDLQYWLANCCYEMHHSISFFFTTVDLLRSTYQAYIYLSCSVANSQAAVIKYFCLCHRICNGVSNFFSIFSVQNNDTEFLKEKIINFFYKIYRHTIFTWQRFMATLFIMIKAYDVRWFDISK